MPAATEDGCGTDDDGQQSCTAERAAFITATGQFGTSHLGDPNDFLPTVHGFYEVAAGLQCRRSDLHYQRLSSATGPRRRREFCYWTDDDLAGLRYDQWKAVFMVRKAHRLAVWAQPMVPLRRPMLFNLR